MKRTSLILLAALLLFTAGCAAKQSPEASGAPAITTPAQKDVTMTLPLGVRDGMTEALSAYTAGFSAANDAPLTFSVGSEDASVAEGALSEDGTLYVIARGAGKTKLTVTAENEAGETASATVSVTVRDARRTVAMILIGVIAVVLLILFGKPVKKKEGPAPEAEQTTGSQTERSPS